MRTIRVISLIIALLSACASAGNPQAKATPSGYPVSKTSSLELATHFRYMPSLSGYYLPSGEYRAEAEDVNGVFFKAPRGLRSVTLTGSLETTGGIYLPKSGSIVRGFVYLDLRASGRSNYMLPNQFFAEYAKKWWIR